MADCLGVDRKQELVQMEDIWTGQWAAGLARSGHPVHWLVAGATGLSVIDLQTGNIVFEHADGNDEQASSAVLTPDGRFISWGQGDGTIGLWGLSD